MVITATKRQQTGKGYARRIRREGKIPAVLYGADFENEHIEVNRSEFLAAIRKSKRNDRFELKVDGETYTVIVRELQWHPVKEEVLHVDFYKLTEGRMVTVDVPVKVVGEAKGVKMGGDLYQPRKKVTIMALPDAIPNEIEIDVSDMQIGDVVHVFDLKLPEGVKVKSSKNFTLVAILGKALEETKEEGEEEEEIEES
ncbi:50S ribosomal protein L25/general stress protein Ctc [Hippea jasoniae]|uniref:50S ribosomal protein L25/general stress protein Ctc n=1 Tax=Hippea jasoniae TaxID=944479 RepID=UPI0005596BF1|nr:50S ribosomal protein L25/general stress protein Ctc [Hippea jasoniae]